MTRARVTLLALGLGVLAAAGWILAVGFGAAAMPSYLAAWLFWLGAPMGALPLVMAAEVGGQTTSPLLTVLRRMLLLLPVGALFAIPVLAASGALFDRAGVPGALPGWWTAPAAFVPRAVVILAVLSLLAILFSFTPSRPRVALGCLGLVLHLVLASLAAVDWVLAAQPALGSSAMGLLLIAGQAVLASCLAAFVLAVGSDASARLPGAAGVLVASLLAGWGFLHFIQYLVVWSANLPAEAAWYLDRGPGLGGATIGFAAAAIALGCALLPTPLGRIPVIMATLSATALLALLFASLWLITPAYRGSFRLTAGDGLAVFGVGGLLVGFLLLLLPRRPSHGPV